MARGRSAATCATISSPATAASYTTLFRLREIQRARYIDGRDIADVFVLIELLVDAGLDAAAVTLANPEPALREADRQRLERARLVMQHFGTNGVPALFRIDGTVLTPVDATSLYQDPLSLISSNHLA
jgi:putative protein-disulfide isomerase